MTFDPRDMKKCGERLTESCNRARKGVYDFASHFKFVESSGGYVREDLCLGSILYLLIMLRLCKVSRDDVMLLMSHSIARAYAVDEPTEADVVESVSKTKKEEFKN